MLNRVTLADVAKKANVSTATVSRVIANSSLISKETKKKVQKVIDNLNYVPNSMAQSLTRNSSKIIGIVLNSKDIDPLSNNFFSEILSGISDYLIKKDYYTLYIHCNNSETEEEYVKSLVGSRRLDGLIFLRAYDDEKLLKYLENIQFPFSIIGTPNDTSEYIWVDNDNTKTTYTITKKLIEQNKKKNICFVGGPMNLKVTNYRYKGYVKALKEKNISKEYIIESLFNIDTAYDIIREYLRNNRKIDAIVTTDDVLAIASIKACKSLNKRNVIVTGFNNTYLKKTSNYNFTTVDIKVKELGKKACELLIQKIENRLMKKNYAIIEANILWEE